MKKGTIKSGLASILLAGVATLGGCTPSEIDIVRAKERGAIFYFNGAFLSTNCQEAAGKIADEFDLPCFSGGDGKAKDIAEKARNSIYGVIFMMHSAGVGYASKRSEEVEEVRSAYVFDGFTKEKINARSVINIKSEADYPWKETSTNYEGKEETFTVARSNHVQLVTQSIPYITEQIKKSKRIFDQKKISPKNNYAGSMKNLVTATGR